jgi:hypothetical protein
MRADINCLTDLAETKECVFMAFPSVLVTRPNRLLGGGEHWQGREDDRVQTNYYLTKVYRHGLEQGFLKLVFCTIVSQFGRCYIGA